MARELRSPRTQRSFSVSRTTEDQRRRSDSMSLVMPRAIARGIDSAIVGAPAALLGTALGQTLDVGFVVVVLLAVYLYETIAVARFGATAGKAIMGLEVVDAETGGTVPVSRAGTRILLVLAVAGAIHLVVPVGPAVAVFLWGSAATAADGRGLPDTVARTTVRRAP